MQASTAPVSRAGLLGAGTTLSPSAMTSSDENPSPALHASESEGPGSVKVGAPSPSDTTLSAWASELYRGGQAATAAAAAATDAVGVAELPASSSPRPSVSVNDATMPNCSPSGGVPSPDHSSQATTGEAAATANASRGAPLGSGPSTKLISWRCGLCGYFLLAMDQEGTPLPLATSAFGDVLPLTCPRCGLTHTSWSQAAPFDQHGDHYNMRTKLSNRYAGQVPAIASQAHRHRLDANDDDPSSTPGVSNAERDAVSCSSSPYKDWLQSRGTAGASDAKAGSLSSGGQQQRQLPGCLPGTNQRRRAYYCGHCQRRLLRIDADGELVPMIRDKDGEVLPITCPGCGDCHSDWEVRPYIAR